jgi:hypothetical protein
MKKSELYILYIYNIRGKFITKLMKAIRLLVSWALLVVLIFVAHISLKAQNANSKVPPFPKSFTLGISSSFYEGFNAGTMTIRDVSDLARRAKIRGMRHPILDQFMETYSLNYELGNLKHISETDSISTISLYLSDPALSHRSKDSITCATLGKIRSGSYANLYTSIWDDSTNGKTPINDTNYFAHYVYHTVKSYNKYVKIYEIWNAPDYSSSPNADRIKGDPGNWWETNPSPCDMGNFRAPFTDYVRMLRIAYEVTKSLDSTSLVALGNIGRENFVDAVLRNTDNPDFGKLSTKFPYKGGAYFDLIAYQSLPQYTLKDWDDINKKFIYKRHSDAGVAKVAETKTKFEVLLRKYGYNDTLYPKKHFMVSRVNIPRKQYTDRDYIGSIEAQRNFLMKLYVTAQKSNLKHVHLHTIGDTKDESQSTSDLEGNDLMGLYTNLNKINSTAAAIPNDPGVGLKTTLSLLEKHRYNAALTDSLKLGTNADGGIFLSGGDTLIVLWAKTTNDLSESVGLVYTLPALFAGPFSVLEVFPWDYSKTKTTNQNRSNAFYLTSSPIVAKLSIYTGINDPLLSKPSIKIYPNPSHNTVTVTSQQPNSQSQVTLTDMMGKLLFETYMPSSTLDLNIANYEAGFYQVCVKNQNGTACQKLIIE